MIFQRFGITYMDAKGAKSMTTELGKTEEGQKRLKSMGEIQTIRWHVTNPVGQPNRKTRRRKPGSIYDGFIHNNSQDRTRHKHFG